MRDIRNGMEGPMTEQKMEELRERLHTAMVELGFEETVINGKIVWPVSNIN